MHFLRMRPAGFPMVRLRQLAELIHKSAHLFSFILSVENIKQLRAVFNASTIINTAIPMLFAYGHYHEEDDHKQKATDLINQLPSEKNSIIVQFKKLQIDSRNAAESQALIELKNTILR